MPQFTLPPYLKWRDGRPRWEPGPRLRPQWRGTDLKDEAGRWLGIDAAVTAAARLNREVAEWRRTGRVRRVDPVPPHRPARTCAALWDAYKKTPEYRAKAPRTRADYTSKVGVFLDAFGDIPVHHVRRADLRTFWERMFDRRGHAMANGVIAVAKLVLGYGVVLEWIEQHPAAKLKLLGVPPRVVVFTDAEIEALVETGDTIGHPEVADAVIVALHTGQRQGDVLALERLAIEDGRVSFHIRKTGARVRVPLTPPLADRLEVISARQRAGSVVDLASARRVIQWRGAPVSATWFGRCWRRVRAAAAARAPGVAEKRFQDLRDTAITRLALADCTVAEIRAITGHSPETVYTILKHYLALDDRMAESGMRKLTAYLKRDGRAV